MQEQKEAKLRSGTLSSPRQRPQGGGGGGGGGILLIGVSAPPPRSYMPSPYFRKYISDFEYPLSPDSDNALSLLRVLPLRNLFVARCPRRRTIAETMSENGVPLSSLFK